jgi:3-carboxy-cis,cis-muconate cycloisomerase
MSLYTPLFSQPAMDEILDDARFVRYMIQFEVMLAQAQGEVEMIPAEAARHIREATFEIDQSQLARGVEQAGVPTIALLRQMREQLNDEAALYLHWGATTQDVMDTALVLQLRDALNHLQGQLRVLLRRLSTLADQHRDTLMVARTHLQQALPTTFGLKVAGWGAPLLRHLERLRELRPRLLLVQLGGAAGTLASMGEAGLEVRENLAARLGLGLPVLPWHTARDNPVELASWLSMLTGSLAKMAQDIILMAQTEIGEVLESDDTTRGSSSTLPQKRNPVISEGIIAAARTNAALVAAMHQALIQEHERATGNWQVEWVTLPQMLRLTASALEKAVFLSANLVVNVERMRANLAASNGVLLAERVSLALAPELGRKGAKAQVRDACMTAVGGNRHLIDVLEEQIDIALDWDALRDEATYLGAADAFIDRILKLIEEENK